MIMSAPSGPITAENLKDTLRKRYGFDSETQKLLDGVGITPEMLADRDFDLQMYLTNRTLIEALKRAVGTEDGRKLLSEASKYQEGSDELSSINAAILERYGDHRTKRFLVYVQGLPQR
jgi:hypothetical protein